MDMTYNQQERTQQAPAPGHLQGSSREMKGRRSEHGGDAAMRGTEDSQVCCLLFLS